MSHAAQICRFKKGDDWHTWIDFAKFLELFHAGKAFSAEDYMVYSVFFYFKKLALSNANNTKIALFYAGVVFVAEDYTV